MIKILCILVVLGGGLWMSLGRERSQNVRKKITISLDWHVNPHHAPILIAKTKGFFEEEGWNVTILPGLGSLEGCKQTHLGTIDYALVTEPQWRIQRAKGLPLSVVATLIRHPLEVLISKVPLSNLKGKRIGHSSSGTGFSAAVFKEILRQQGFSESDVTPMYTRHSLVNLLISDQVDAIINGWRTYEEPQVRQNGLNAIHVYAYENLGIPSFAALIMVAHEQRSLKESASIRSALKEAIDFIRHSPKEAFDLLIKTYPELDTPLNHNVWPDIVSVFSENIEPMTVEENLPLRQFLQKSGLLPSEDIKDR